MLEEPKRLLHRHVQDFIDIASLVPYLQRLSVIAVSMADFAGDIYIRKEVHFNLDDTVSGTCFTPAALDIEGEAAFLITPCFCVIRTREQITDLVKNTCISGRIGSWRAPDRALVDADHLVQFAIPCNGVMLSHHLMGAIQFIGERLIEDLIDQRTLSRTGYAGHAGKYSERELYVDVLQIVLRCAEDCQPACRFSSCLRNRDLQSSGQIRSGDRFSAVLDILRASRRHNLSAMLPGAGTDVNQEVCSTHGVFVMFDDNHGIAQIPQVIQRIQKFVVVPLVKSDGRLIQNIGDSHQAGTDLGRQADALRLTA